MKLPADAIISKDKLTSYLLLPKKSGDKSAYLARRMRGLDPGEVETLERAAGIIERLLEDETGGAR